MWAAADEVYGRCGEFRDACRALNLAYVVIIPCDYRVTLAKNKVIRADEALRDAVFERRSCGNGTKGPRYGDWALIATAGPREFLLIRRLPRREKNQYTFYLCWAPEDRPATMTYFVTIAGRRWPVETTFKTGRGHPRLGPVPGQDLGRDLPAHRPDRPRPAQDRRHPRRPHRRRRGSRHRAGHRPPGSTAAAATGEDAVTAADLQFYRYGAPVPVRGGQPCPPGIPPIELSATETARIEPPRPRLESRAPHHRPPRLPSPLVTMAPPPPGPRPLAPLRHPPPGPRHLTHDGRKEVTPCNHQHGNHDATLSCSAVTDRKTATVIHGCVVSPVVYEQRPAGRHDQAQ